ncbi:hypothetical protein [Silvibacterium sp.]|uniref:hypothetical protein n=1 Tax=Silvibacterium sp. TaxID=1964179 RepID=UPI0039E236F2
MNLFAKKNPEKMQQTQVIKRRVIELLELNDDATVMVTELNCQDEDCPEVETVIALFRPGVAEIKSTLHSSIEEISEEDIQNLCQSVRAKVLAQTTPTNLEEVNDLPL